MAANYGNPALQVTFPASYDISAIVNGSGSFEESRCPMVAVNDPAKTELDFYHVGGQAHREWSLTEHQWDYYAEAFPTSFPVPAGTTYHQSYFSWGTGDRPQDVYVDTGESYWDSYVDWGIHFDDKGLGSDTYTEGSWYTLSSDEWNYLLRTGQNSGTHAGTADIYDPVSRTYIRGIVVMPDAFSAEGVSFRPGVLSDPSLINQYSAGDPSMGRDGPWSDMEEMGALFLPFCGRLIRTGAEAALIPTGMGQFGYYWSSSRSEYTGQAFNVQSSGGWYGVIRSPMYFGRAIRLVRD